MKLKELLQKRRKAVGSKSKMELTIEIALYHEEERNYKDAFDEYKELLSLSLDAIDLIMQAKAYRQMGECMLELQRPEKALEYVKLYFKAAKSCGDLFEIQRAFVTIGRCYLDVAMTLRSPKEKQTSLNQSESAFVKSLQMIQKLSEMPNSGSSQSESKLEREFAEMRVVSMFNLGLVNREKSTEPGATTAEKYLSQCSSLSIKNKLFEMHLRAIYERIDLKYNCAVQCAVSPPDQQQSAKTHAGDAVKLIKSSLKQLASVTFTADMKKQRRHIQQLEARLLLVSGQVLKAAKKYRNLRSQAQSGRDRYGQKMKCCICLERKLKLLTTTTKKPSSTESVLLGQLYEELEVPLLAARHYKQALETVAGKASEESKMLVNKLIAINSCCKRHTENVSLLQSKLRQLLREQSKNGISDRLSARLCCGLILRVIDSLTQAGSITAQKEKVLGFVAQLESMARVAESASVEAKALKAAVGVYGQLYGEDSEETRTVTARRDRLRAIDGDEEGEEGEEDEFNCLSPSDEYTEPELPSLELPDSEYEEDCQLSSDSDMDHRVLTECQIEELEAVGKRIPSNKNKSLIKRNEKGETMLHEAAIKGSVKQTEHLIFQMKHPVDILDTAGWTPLHDAANHGRTKVVEILLDNGANIDHKGPRIERSTPLMEAINGGNIDTALLLMDRGADLWHKNSAGENVGDCIDGWRQRCVDNETYRKGEIQAYHKMTGALRERLGARYIEWCRQRRGSSGASTSMPVAVASKKRPVNCKAVRDGRRVLDFGDDEGEGEEEEEESEDEDDAVTNYCNAMTSLARTKNKKGKKGKENEECVQEVVGYVVGDDWLEDDMGKRPKTAVCEPHYGAYERPHKRQQHSLEEEEEEEPRQKRGRFSQEEEPRQKRGRIIQEEEEDIFKEDSEEESTPRRQEQQLPATVTVTYRALQMVVPLRDRSSTVQWLLTEVLRRYSLLAPHDPLAPGTVVHISREDGALLLPSDDLLAAIGDSGGLVRRLCALDAAVPLALRSLIPDRFIALHADVKAALGTGHLDLGARHLSAGLLEFLASLHFTQGLPPLTSVCLADNDVTDDLLNKTLSNNHGTFSLALFLQHHSASIETLDLSGNGFSGVAFSDFLHNLRKKALGSLRTLNLSRNPLDSDGDFSVMSLVLRPLLGMCPSLESLVLSGCGLGDLSELSCVPSTSSPLDDVLGAPQTRLAALDLSHNPGLVLKRESTSKVAFWRRVAPSLHSLSLRGCRASVSASPHHHGGSNHLSPIQETVAALVDLLSNGRCGVESLDLGDCGLDEDSLQQLYRLFSRRSCRLRTLICDENAVLAESTYVWAGLLHNLSLPLCPVERLVVDMPSMSSADEYLAVVDSVQRKVGARVGRPLAALCLRVGHRRGLMDAMKVANGGEEHGAGGEETLEEVEAAVQDMDEDQREQCLAVRLLMAVRHLLGGTRPHSVRFEGDRVTVATTDYGR